MKSFTDQQTEELNKKVKLDEATAGDFLLGLGAAGGAWALKKAWDKFKPAITKKQKTAKAQKKLDKAKEKQDQKDTKADADALKYEKDEDGIIVKPGDADKYKKTAGKAPAGWETDKETGKLIRKESKVPEKTMTITESNELQAIMALDDAGISAEINRKGQVVVKKKDLEKAEKALKKSFKKGGEPKLVGEETIGDVLDQIVVEAELEEASSKKARNKAADEIEAIADKGGAEAPALFSLASKLRKGTHSTTGLKLSKKVTAILKVNGIKEEVQKTRTAYEVVSKARKRSIKNKPQWEQD